MKPVGSYVYAVEVDGVVRYIGKGSGARIDGHARRVSSVLRRRAAGQSVKTSGFHHRLIKAIASGAEWSTRIVAEGMSDAEAFALEAELISFCPNGQLWNSRPGGLGGMSPEEAERRRTDPKWRAAKSDAMRGYYEKPGARDLAKAIAKERVKLPQVAAGLEVGRRSVDARAKANAALSARYSTPEGREQCRAKAAIAHSRPESRAKMTAACVAAWNDPEKRAARCAAIKASWIRRRERANAVSARGRSATDRPL